MAAPPPVATTAAAVAVAEARKPEEAMPAAGEYRRWWESRCGSAAVQEASRVRGAPTLRRPRPAERFLRGWAAEEFPGAGAEDRLGSSAGAAAGRGRSAEGSRPAAAVAGMGAAVAGRDGGSAGTRGARRIRADEPIRSAARARRWAPVPAAPVAPRRSPPCRRRPDPARRAGRRRRWGVRTVGVEAGGTRRVSGPGRRRAPQARPAPPHRRRRAPGRQGVRSRSTISGDALPRWGRGPRRLRCPARPAGTQRSTGVTTDRVVGGGAHRV